MKLPYDVHTKMLLRPPGQDCSVELDAFLAAAIELLAVPSTADRPEQLRCAVESVVDFVGPGFSVERFESNGKPSALVYADGIGGATRPEIRDITNVHLDMEPGEGQDLRPRSGGDQ